MLSGAVTLLALGCLSGCPTGLPGTGKSKPSLSGEISALQGNSVDSDVNDPNAPYQGNDDIEHAQSVTNPSVIGGFVSGIGTGRKGDRFANQGDPDDFYHVSLRAGQVISLYIGGFDPQSSPSVDLDLQLMELATNTSNSTTYSSVVTSNCSFTQTEAVVVPHDGDFYIQVNAVSDSISTYVLTIGSLAAGSGCASLALQYDFVPGEAVVRFRDAAPAGAAVRGPALSDRVRALGLTLKASGGGGPALVSLGAGPATAVYSVLGIARQTAPAQGLDRTARAKADTIGLVKALRARSDVASADLNFIRRPLLLPNDTHYSKQWQFPLLNLPQAWDLTTGSAAVIVAVIDTGVVMNHPDLQANLLTTGYDFISDPQSAADGDGIDANPDDAGDGSNGTASTFHGTHVAGTIAAVTNNGSGVAGVAWNSKIMPLRVLGRDGGTDYDIMQALRYAARLSNDSGTLPPQRADVINLSLGGPGSSQEMADTIQQVHDQGVLVVAAAGNEGYRNLRPGDARVTFPAAYEHVIAVGAVDRAKNIAAYSNAGYYIDVVAPGGDESSTVANGILSTLADDSGGSRLNTYGYYSGTSMAAPHVAAVFALMKSVNPDLGTADLERLLRNGALTDDLGPLGRDDGYGYGLINASRAINAALDAIGGSPGTSAALAASSSSLNLGAELEGLDFALRNTGQGDIGQLSIETNVEWLSVRAVEVDGKGLGRYRAEADRSLLADGIYRGLIVATSAINQVTIDVLVSVGGQSEANVGTVYILLYDPESESVVDQVVARPGPEGYRFRFPSAPTGQYELVAGTDIDNDLFICDPGEACGAWLTIDQPLLLELDGDREDIEFTIEYLVAIPTPSATPAQNAMPATARYRRRPAP